MTQTVLVVDDDPDIVDFLHAALEGLAIGCSVP